MTIGRASPMRTGWHVGLVRSSDGMHGIKVSIVRFVDGSFFPGLVECRLVDAAGVEHAFIEKIPILTTEDLRSDTTYPCPGVIACRIVAEHAERPETVTVDTEQPWGIASTEGRSRFDVCRQELVDI